MASNNNMEVPAYMCPQGSNSIVLFPECVAIRACKGRKSAVDVDSKWTFRQTDRQTDL